MSVKTVTTTTCDNPECAKDHNAHPRQKNTTYTRAPMDPWLSICVGGHYVTAYGEALETHLDACCAECAIKILEKAIERIKKVPVLDDMRIPVYR